MDVSLIQPYTFSHLPKSPVSKHISYFLRIIFIRKSFLEPSDLSPSGSVALYSGILIAFYTDTLGSSFICKLGIPFTSGSPVSWASSTFGIIPPCSIIPDIPPVKKLPFSLLQKLSLQSYAGEGRRSCLTVQ